MKGFRPFPRSATVAAASLLAVVAIAGTAQAVTDTIFKYTAPKTGFFSIHPMAMSLDGDGAQYSIATGAITLTAPPGVHSSCFSSGVNLPNGARVTQVTVYYTSGPMGASPAAAVTSQKLSDGTLATMASRKLLDNSATRVANNLTLTVNAADLAINNGAFSYGFAFCLGTIDNKFHAARISYTYDTAGD